MAHRITGTLELNRGRGLNGVVTSGKYSTNVSDLVGLAEVYFSLLCFKSLPASRTPYLLFIIIDLKRDIWPAQKVRDKAIVSL